MKTQKLGIGLLLGLVTASLSAWASDSVPTVFARCTSQKMGFVLETYVWQPAGALIVFLKGKGGGLKIKF